MRKQSPRDGSIDDPTTLAHDLANSPYNGLKHMHKYSHLVSQQDKVMLESIIKHIEPLNSAYHYFIFRDEDDFDFDQLYADQKAHKEQLAEKLRVYAEDHFQCSDIGVNWHPLEGLSIAGVLFRKKPNPTMAKGDRQRALEEKHLRMFCNWTLIHNYDERGDVYLAKPDNRTGAGRVAQEQLNKLKEEVQGPSEINDFFSAAFGVFRAMGTAKIDGNRTQLLAAKFDHLALGLFMRLPQDRLYEVPDGFEQVNQTAYAFAQELESTFALRAKSLQEV